MRDGLVVKRELMLLSGQGSNLVTIILFVKKKEDCRGKIGIKSIQLQWRLKWIFPLQCSIDAICNIYCMTNITSSSRFAGFSFAKRIITQVS